MMLVSLLGRMRGGCLGRPRVRAAVIGANSGPINVVGRNDHAIGMFARNVEVGLVKVCNALLISVRANK